MIYGYCRCSTNETKQDVNRQKRELKKLGAADSTLYFEYESGTKVNRPELMKLLDTVQAGDTIVTTEISRITRSTKQLCDILDLVKQKHLKLVIENSITIDCTNGDKIDPMSMAFLQMAGVFAELERNMICDRVKSGLDNAKAKGVKLGRPSLTVEEVPEKFKKYFKKYRNGEINKSELAKLTELSRPTVNKYIAIMTDR